MNSPRVGNVNTDEDATGKTKTTFKKNTKPFT
jgi:hypothetical protein